MIVTIVGIGLLIANLIILGLNFKLYTEYFKDKSQSSRRKDSQDE